MSVNIVNSDGSTSKIAGGIPSDDLEIIKGDLAGVESTSIASKAYAQGDIFVMSTGQLVRAISAIAQGDTITLNTNVLVTSIAELLDEKADITDLDDKVDKVTGGTNGNLAKLDANGNLADGGWASDKTITSATGNPISISGLKSNQLAVNPIITLEPIQAGSGTPSPSNIRAISGYDKIEVLSCGKNLFDISKVLVGTVSNGLWTWGGSTSKLFDLKFKANTQYTFSGYQTQSGQNKNVRPRIIYTDGTAENIYTSTSTTRTAFTKTSAEDKTIDYIQAYYGSDSRATVTIENFQIEESTSATTYVPYHKTTDLSESLGQTVYWGRLNVRTGEFEVLGIKVIYDGSSDENWAEYPSYNGFCFANPSSMLSSNWGSGWSSHFTKLTTHGNIGIRFGAGNTTLYFEQITNNISGVSDVATWRTWLSNNNIEVVYPITPFTIQLTPHEISLLKNYAYVSTNGTSIALDYHNGEIATLGDVAQLGETVNELLLGINDKGEFQLDSDWTGTVDVYRLGKMVMLNINIHKADGTNFSANTNYEIGKLPIGYTTRKTQFGAGIELTSNVIDVCRVMVRNSNNQNVLVSTSSAGTYIQCTMVYWIIQ